MGCGLLTLRSTHLWYLASPWIVSSKCRIRTWVLWCSIIWADFITHKSLEFASSAVKMILRYCLFPIWWRHSLQISTLLWRVVNPFLWWHRLNQSSTFLSHLSLSLSPSPLSQKRLEKVSRPLLHQQQQAAIIVIYKHSLQSKINCSYPLSHSHSLSLIHTLSLSISLSLTHTLSLFLPQFFATNRRQEKVSR